MSRKRKSKDQRTQEIEQYWKSLSLPQKVKALKDQGITLPHSITFQDKEVAFLQGF